MEFKLNVGWWCGVQADKFSSVVKSGGVGVENVPSFDHAMREIEKNASKLAPFM